MAARKASKKKAAKKQATEASLKEAVRKALKGRKKAKTFPKRQGGLYLDSFLEVWTAAESFGGEKFTTTDLVERSGRPYSSVYKWLVGMDEHNLVYGYLDVTRTARGDFRWQLKKKLVDIEPEEGS